MSAAPIPSRLIFLSELPQCSPRDKVRFLGWHVIVDKYDVKSGTLSLSHTYPKDIPTPIMAFINVDHVLESVRSADLEVGAWINVVGYIIDSKEEKVLKKSRKSSRRQQGTLSIRVQAIMLWSAGMLNVDAYEKALQERLSISV
ncbi:hypothetical protein NA57DRAFT_50421 [Rhizodiscina lignyota]|uniref:CST complex subunit Ten1 n=1 Tax=Rhizodiscina lignyota TaxID=1504668 RepID=A0A9P4M2K7_9PEZI|nr:hypothetical protein NA57DRAFT_50421 [Rhizodiscina lignyota]